MNKAKRQRIENRIKWKLVKEFNLQSEFKELGLTADEKSLVNSALTKLEKNPYKDSAELTKTAGLRRVRANKYRIIYKLKEHSNLIVVKHIEHRDNLYDSILEQLMIFEGEVVTISEYAIEKGR